jgi:hypothetical protein
MKKIANSILVLSVILAFGSCKKNSSSPSNTITCTIGGSSKTFNAAAIATKTTSSGFTTITITGFSAASSSAANLSLAIATNNSGDVIAAGTYSDTSSQYTNESLYTPSASGSVNYGAGTSVSANAVNDGVTIANHLKIVVTSISSTEIAGTFSGDQFPNSDDHQTPIILTDGKFDVKFK